MVNSSVHSTNTVFVYGITLLFFALAFIGVYHHELWLDEAHHWLLARDSNTFLELIKNTRYEGHPVLWNVILYGITRVTLNPIWMQLLHIVIATASVFVFLKRAPFSIVFKLLFIFGYFILFEYTLVSRNYALGLLFILLACTYFNNSKEKLISIAVFLALAANTHAIFLVLSGCTFLVVFWEKIKNQKLQFSKNTLLGFTIYFIGALLAVIQIIPPEDTGFFDAASTVSFSEKIPKAIFPFLKGVFILQDMRLSSFWNTNLLINSSKLVGGCIGILSLSVPLFLFYKNKTIIAYSYFTICCVGLFFYITQLSAARYFGVLYLMIIVGLWLQAYLKADTSRFKISEEILKKIRNTIIYSILFLQSIAGIYAYTMDVKTPFTAAEKTAQFIAENGYKTNVIASQSCSGTAISAYLEKKVYFTKTNSFESFCPWNHPQLNEKQSKEGIISSLEKVLESTQESVIFVSNHPIFSLQEQEKWETPTAKISCNFLQKFEESIINKGTYYVYKISKK